MNIRIGDRSTRRFSNTAAPQLEVDDFSRSSHGAESLATHILVVDDDPIICRQLARLYSQRDYRVTIATLAEQALELLEDQDIDLVVTDLRLPGMSGVDLTRRVLERWNDIPIIVMTGFGEIREAVNLLKAGVSDYIVKPFEAAIVQQSTELALQKTAAFADIRRLRRTLGERYEFGGMLSKTPEMHRVFEIIRMVAPTDSTVVVEGETGTGKELVASAIHDHSLRREGAYVTINCGALPEGLLESELFGYERGAFTGADQARAGKIELADGGTLFLDEIENMPLSMQSKLLLVLNNNKVQRLGSGRWLHVDMRVIAASNVPLKELLTQGKMRSDFYYRIHVIPIRLSPLRQRLEDLALLAQDFLRHHPMALRKKVKAISPKAMELLMRYSWPGNIRELQNVLEKAVVLAKSGVLDVADLDLDLVRASSHVNFNDTDISPALPFAEWIRRQEREYLIQMLKKSGGRINLTAKSCGLDLRTLHRKMRLHGLDKKTFYRKALKTANGNHISIGQQHNLNEELRRNSPNTSVDPNTSHARAS
jgi:two-component system, NtrC family, response regulator HydG